MQAIEISHIEFNSNDPEGLKRCVPAVIHTCAQIVRQQVSTVGLFRVSGSDKRINALIKNFDTGPEFGAHW